MNKIKELKCEIVKRRKGEIGYMSQQDTNLVRTCEDLLLEYKKKNIQVKSSKIKFVLCHGKKDVYNITAPFAANGKTWIAGRVEARNSEASRIGFFEERDGVWVEDERNPICLQDPFTARIGKTLILGGVEVFDQEGEPGTLNYRTVFFKGNGIYDLTRFAQGPDGMKDIRLCEMKDGRILVFTRPQGETGGRGKIGWCFLEGLKDLDPSHLEKAQILENQFVPEEWGGVNELHLIAGGKIGALSHIARFDSEGNRHYYSTVFCFDPETGAYGPMKMIARRKDFKPGPGKRPDLEDVIFSGGIHRLSNGTAMLYCGVSDVEGQSIVIDDPFKPYEADS